MGDQIDFLVGTRPEKPTIVASWALFKAQNVISLYSSIRGVSTLGWA
jgi:hypothetical protein